MCPINKRRIIKNTLFLYLKVIVNTIVLLYSTSLILNALGVIDYGIYGVVGGVIAMLGYLNTAMAKTTQRFLSFAEGKRDKAKQKVVFNTSVMLHLGIGVSIFILNFEYSRGTYGCCSVYLSYDGGEHFIYNPYGSL